MIQKICLLFAFSMLGNISSSYGYQNEIESFYYTTSLKTIEKYIDDNFTSLGGLYEYKKFLEEKITTEFHTKNIQILFSLYNLNNENIKNHFLSLQNSKSNIEIFIKYFENKHPEYQTHIERIKNTHFINSKDENGNTFLEILLKHGSYQDIEFALNRGLDTNNIDTEENITFLNFLRNGGKFFPSDYLDKSLAGKMDIQGTEAIFHLIMKRGYSINLSDKKNENIAFAIIDTQQKNLFSYILERNDLDFSQKNNAGENILLFAIKKGLDKTFLFPLIQHPKIDINATDNNWESALFLLSNKENEYFHELFKRNIKINQQNKLGQTELMKIIQQNSDQKNISEKYQLLSSYQPIDIEQVDQNGETALFKAIENNHGEFAQELMLITKNINTLNLQGKNILLTAIDNFSGSGEILQEILQYPIDINHQDNEGNTAFHALLKKDIPLGFLQDLAIKKINFNILNNKNENLLTYIIEKNDSELFLQLLEYGLNINTIISEEKNNIFLEMVKEQRLNLLKIVLQNKNLLQLDINFVDNNNNNALHYAIKNNNFEISHLLIENKIHINQANSENITPLMIASEIGNTNILRSLGSIVGIDVKNQDIHGENALLYACKKGNENIIRMLLAIKTPQIKNKDGKGCIDFILESNLISKDIFQYLQ